MGLNPFEGSNPSLSVFQLRSSRVYSPLLSIAALLALSACTPATRPSTNSLPLAVPTESELSRRPALVRMWEDRLTSTDANVRAPARDFLAQEGARSLPLLRRLLRSRRASIRRDA